MYLNELPTRTKATVSRNEPMKEDETLHFYDFIAKTKETEPPNEPVKEAADETPHLYDYITTGDMNPTLPVGESAENTDVELTPCAAYGTNIAAGAKKLTT